MFLVSLCNEADFRIFIRLKDKDFTYNEIALTMKSMMMNRILTLLIETGQLLISVIPSMYSL
ncbi:hypothetical protein [uncultured Kordia sp.]|uniref:hypothetical protein n=1 Tax=uncultured Kordia sp. TaxID=507699 RepID=UPI00260E8C6B|nr:hypothetical protein [uncultured Kordia sp.]